MNDENYLIKSILEWDELNNPEKVWIWSAGEVKTSSDGAILRDERKTYSVLIINDFYKFCEEINKTPKNAIEMVLASCETGGKVYLLMENKLGMKYWAGCQEEQNGGLFVGIENYAAWSIDAIRPLTKGELEDLLKSCLGVKKYKFYYPYPDYKYPTMIFTDDYLPSEGMLNRNIRNIDRDRFVLFDEMKAFDSVIKAGQFPEFSNSFMVCIE